MDTQTSNDTAARAEFRAFVEREVAPYADTAHRIQHTERARITALAEAGYLGANIAPEFGGAGLDMVTLGELAGELGRGCSSIRSLFTVHTMVAQAIGRWGTRAQRERWLPRLASGETLAAFALSEPEVGSDANSVQTRAQAQGEGWRLEGHKTWITYGALADLFLVFARTDEGPTAFLVERERAGVRTEPIFDMVGIRASETASVHLEGCELPGEALLAREGLGISHVSGVALDLGRYTVAWGCVGIVDACLERSLDYTATREQFGVALREHQLVRRLVTDMMTDARAARLLCLDAGRLRDARDPGAYAASSMAKYFASVAATRSAANAMQLHGARGCSGDYPFQRLLGDARVAEVIEGSTQLQQSSIAEYGYQTRPRPAKRGAA